MTAARQRFQPSDLSRHSSRVFSTAEGEPVDVTRRDGGDFVLMSKREATARNGLLELAATLIAVTTDDKGTLADRLANALPWMLALSPQDRTVCAKNVLDAARASFATGQSHLAAAEITSWRETAAAIAAGLGQTSVEWLADTERVARP